MNGFFAKIGAFFAKIGKNCTPFDVFLILFGTFDRVSPLVFHISKEVEKLKLKRQKETKGQRDKGAEGQRDKGAEWGKWKS